MRMRIRAPLTTALLALTFTMPLLPARADEADFLSRFEGRWSGGGSMKPTARSLSVPLDCSANGDSGSRTLSLGGRCSALILSRDLSANLTYDPATNRYTGVYITEGDPPAALNGARSGDSLVLAVRWPKPVKGDSDATMIIRNAGQGRFTFAVRDAAELGGVTVTTASFTLHRDSRSAQGEPSGVATR